MQVRKIYANHKKQRRHHYRELSEMFGLRQSFQEGNSEKNKRKA